MLSADDEFGDVSECVFVNMSVFLEKWCCSSALDTVTSQGSQFKSQTRADKKMIR
jgi:hypothetical protein